MWRVAAFEPVKAARFSTATTSRTPAWDCPWWLAMATPPLLVKSALWHGCESLIRCLYAGLPHDLTTHQVAIQSMLEILQHQVLLKSSPNSESEVNFTRNCGPLELSKQVDLGIIAPVTMSGLVSKRRCKIQTLPWLIDLKLIQVQNRDLCVFQKWQAQNLTLCSRSPISTRSLGVQVSQRVRKRRKPQRLDVGGRFKAQVVGHFSPDPGSDRRDISKSGKIKVGIVLQVQHRIEDWLKNTEAEWMIQNRQGKHLRGSVAVSDSIWAAGLKQQVKQQEDRAWYASVHVENGRTWAAKGRGWSKDGFVQTLIHSMSRNHKRHSSLNVILLAWVIDGRCCQPTVFSATPWALIPSLPADVESSSSIMTLPSGIKSTAFVPSPMTASKHSEGVIDRKVVLNRKRLFRVCSSATRSTWDGSDGSIDKSSWSTQLRPSRRTNLTRTLIPSVIPGTWPSSSAWVRGGACRNISSQHLSSWSKNLPGNLGPHPSRNLTPSSTAPRNPSQHHHRVSPTALYSLREWPPCRAQSLEAGPRRQPHGVPLPTTLAELALLGWTVLEQFPPGRPPLGLPPLAR